MNESKVEIVEVPVTRYAGRCLRIFDGEDLIVELSTDVVHALRKYLNMGMVERWMDMGGILHDDFNREDHPDAVRILVPAEQGE